MCVSEVENRGVYPTPTGQGSPIVALSAGKVYVESNHNLWAAPLP